MGSKASCDERGEKRSDFHVGRIGERVRALRESSTSLPEIDQEPRPAPKRPAIFG